ncbi:hypothetical protein [Patiriisocius hiemis]|uniref:Uncharacterized protein n=1 Tax=Patiriisocius hiemis TaxID=3075604 RepID=A0ABU2YB82_9FLAO|nr:hypothetical protein [Constantimarinum sp. W242]MDT0555451.1 hypothetical protein [Constantimarinum sp. W242]
MKNKKEVSFIKRYSILLLAFIYLLSPIQQPLLEGFHTISHALTQIDSHSHSHTVASKNNHVHDHSHSHEHKLLSFLKKVLTNTTNDHKTQSQFVKYDKHFSEENTEIEQRLLLPYIYNFFYRTSGYINYLTLELPPPKHSFT